MTPEAKYEACRAIAPDFRIGIEYTILLTVSRALVWHGTPPGSLTPMSAGITFAPGEAFEPRFDELLTRALAALQTAR